MNTAAEDCLRVLVLDDEEEILELYREFLAPGDSHRRFHLTLCLHAQQAVEAADAAVEKDEPFAVAFLDVHMASGNDGVWAAEHIRRVDPTVEIVLVTGYSDVNPTTVFPRVPPAHKLLYLRKPFYQEEIKHLADALVAKWQQEREIHERQTNLEASVRQRTAALTRANEELKNQIRKREHAEERLGETEQRYRSLVESTPDWVWSVDTEGRITYSNDSVTSLLGYELPDILGSSFFSFMHPEDRERSEETYRGAMEDKRGWRNTVKRWQHRDGSCRYFESTGWPLLDSEGHLLGFSGIDRDISERKQAEQALRREKEKYRTLVEESPLGVSIIGEDGRYEYVNPKFVAMFGYTLADVPTGRHWFARGFPDQAYRKQAVTAWVNDLEHSAHREARPRTFTVTCKDGSEKVISFRPVTLGTGKQLVIYEDITDRERAEEAMRENERFLENVLDAIQDGISVRDRELNVVRVNQWMESTYGPQAELIGKKCYHVFQKRTSPCPWCPAIPAMETGEPRQATVPYPTADLPTGWLEVSAFPLRNGEDRIVGAIEHLKDVTERKRAEEALRASESKYRELVQNANSIILRMDTRGRITFFNEFAQRFFGYTEEEILGRNVVGTIVPETDTSGRDLAAMIEDIARHPENYATTENENTRRNGERVWVAWANKPVFDDHGRITEILCIGNDITERNLLEKQLLQSQKMEAIGTLAGGVAHDFNNLLQAIQGYAELLQFDKDREERGYHELQEILRAARRGGELTQQLLTFSRKLESRKRPFDLNQGVHQVMKLLERTLPKMINIKVELAEDLNVINGDPAQMEQVLMNLALNAKDAMAEAGTLLIQTRNVRLDEEFSRTHASATPGDYVLLTVSDTGRGMDQETLEHIFEPFFTTKGRAQGTGLGLAIVYGIVKSHEGYIICSSEPGGGTTFTIYLPAIQRKTESEDMPEAGMPQGGVETILLVDDEEPLLELGAEMLGKFGYTVLTAPDGESALEIYRTKHKQIDLVVLDLIMPGMGGRRCLEELLQIDAHARVLIASGHSPDEVMQDHIRVAARGFVSKPFDIRQMLRGIRKALDEH
jgi:PAS domain S-box-containing protein